MESIISSYCRIRNNAVWLNGELYYEFPASEDPAGFYSALYRKMGLQYPKFFKMDKLCKPGILAAELLIRNTTGFGQIPGQETALILANRASSLESDRAHAATIADTAHYFPSPSVFVYTLPNIVAGEIAIRHKLTGENAFFVSEAFDAKLMYQYTSLLLGDQAASAAICGWINADGEESEAFVYCVKSLTFKQENEAFERPHHTENIQLLYHS